ncbi:hypothetical protein [Phyllobacterium leguminum]|uniref:hypothetical protein n=1 Tax=Phyllobacterium leguminum TaxID=314237 RepID=UPI0011B645CE|nr:hypothetical protein [Phyllobacterium leguminum]
MKADAFKKGFMRGFSAPFLFFSPIEIRRPSQFNGSVAKAWADVGRVLSDATAAQGTYLEQKADKSKRSKRR